MPPYIESVPFNSKAIMIDNTNKENVRARRTDTFKIFKPLHLKTDYVSFL